MSRFDGSIFTHVELCNFQKYLYSTFSLLLQGVKVFFCKIFQIQARLKHAEKRSNPFEFFQICPNWTWTPCMILVVFKSRVINGNNMIFHMFSRKNFLSINYLIVKLWNETQCFFQKTKHSKTGIVSSKVKFIFRKNQVLLLLSINCYVTIGRHGN